MNHPSEWVKFFDERAGRFRYKHKGSGLVRDTLMAIGKTLKKGATNVARSSAEKAGKKLSEVVVEKGSDKIQRILQRRRPKTPTPKPQAPRPAPKVSSRDAMIKLSRILAKEV